MSPFSMGSGRKKLTVTYVLRGIVGVFRVDEVQGYLRSHLRLGYPKKHTLEDELITPLTSEQIAVRSRKPFDVHWRGKPFLVNDSDSTSRPSSLA
jgi:hypothetical protein